MEEIGQMGHKFNLKQFVDIKKTIHNNNLEMRWDVGLISIIYPSSFILL